MVRRPETFPRCTGTNADIVVTSSAPKMWTFVFLLVIFQVVMFGGYLVYKRRRDTAPKKYL